jgi:MFS family permease
MYKKKEKLRGEELILKDATFAADSASAAVKNSVTNSLIIPFAAMTNAPNEFIALISTVPNLVGSFVQLFTSDLLNIVRRRKTVIVITSFIDAILWMPLMLIPFFWQSNHFLLLNILILQAIAISIMRPFYNSLLGDIIPKDKRADVIAKLNRVSGIATLIATLLFGLILTLFKNLNPMIGFTVVFFMAFVAKTMSSFLKLSYEDNRELIPRQESIMRFIKDMKRSNYGKFVLYVSLMQFAIGIASPFFAVYMLKNLGFSFIEYTFINVASMVASLFAFSKIGKLIDKGGSKNVLNYTGYFIGILPLFWLFFKNPFALFIVQFLYGIAWAAFNVSVSNFVYDATSQKNRLVMNSYFNFFSGIFGFFGAFLGSMMMNHLPSNYYGSIFLFLFFISAILRIIISAYYLPRIDEARFVSIKLDGDRVLTIQPHQNYEYEFLPVRKF